jgi:hypothetical protein
MPKLFEFDANRKSFIELVSEETLTNLPAFGLLPKFENTVKGGSAFFDISSTGDVLRSNSAVANIFTSGGTAIGYINPLSAGGSNAGRVVDKAGSSINGFAVYTRDLLNGKVKLYFINGFTGGLGIWETATQELEINRFSFFAITYNSSSDTNDPVFYINDGMPSINEVSAPSGTSKEVSRVADIGNRKLTLPFDGYISKIILYDEILPVLEINKEYAKFLKVSSNNIEKNNFFISRPRSISSTNLVAAYSFFEPGNDTDISNNGNNGTLTGTLKTLNGKYFDGVDDKEVFGNLGNIKSIAFRIKLDSTTEKILEGSANDKLVHVNAGTLTYPDFDNAYINGADSDTLQANLWYNIVIVSSTNILFSACTLALNNVTYGNFEISDLKFYSDEKNQIFAQKYNNNFNQIAFKDDFRFEPADGTNILPKDYIQGTGSFKIGEITSFVSKELDIFIKYMECTSSGYISHKNTQAYGIYDFFIYKGADANQLNVYFINDRDNISNENGYAFIVDNNEAIILSRRDVGAGTTLFSTSNSYIANSTWYKIRIERNRAINEFHTGNIGSIRALIKGGAFSWNDWVVVDVSGGSGTNPVLDNTHAISSNSVYDIDTLDIVTNINYRSAI